LISYKKKNPTTTFIQLLRTEKFLKKIKKKYNEKKKKEKSHLNIIASEDEKRKINKFIKYVN
jgi:hypothetical protein